jgi:hypothetical protein
MPLGQVWPVGWLLNGPVWIARSSGGLLFPCGLARAGGQGHRDGEGGMVVPFCGNGGLGCSPCRAGGDSALNDGGCGVELVL